MAVGSTWLSSCFNNHVKAGPYSLYCFVTLLAPIQRKICNLTLYFNNSLHFYGSCVKLWQKREMFCDDNFFCNILVFLCSAGTVSQKSCSLTSKKNSLSTFMIAELARPPSVPFQESHSQAGSARAGRCLNKLSRLIIRLSFEFASSPSSDSL